MRRNKQARHRREILEVLVFFVRKNISLKTQELDFCVLRKTLGIFSLKNIKHCSSPSSKITISFG